MRNLLVAALAVVASAHPSPEAAAPRGLGIKTFDLHLTWGQYAPDGYSRDMMLVNGASPGPPIEVDQGNWVVVKVHNDSPKNTTLHFHGIEMYGTPWSDGVPGVTQRPIPPGDSFTYQFLATQHGSYWYHSHYRGQIEDGLYGPIVIHPLKGLPKPFSKISKDAAAVREMDKAEKKVVPLVISDLSHLTSDEKWNMALEVGFEDSCYDSILFNGKGSIECLPEDEMTAHLSDVQKGYLALAPGSSITDKGCLPAEVLKAIGGGIGNLSAVPEGVFTGCNQASNPLEVIKAHKGWVAIDIVGAINFLTTTVSVDEHDMWVYAMDGAYIEPQKVQGIVVGQGDRYGILVKADKPGNFKIRSNSLSPLQIITGHAILSIDSHGSDSDSVPYIDIAGMPASPDVVFFNQATAAPFPPDPIPKSADELFLLNMDFAGASYLWALNSTKLTPEDLEDDDTPTLFQPEPYVRNNVTITTRYNTWVDLVFFAASFPLPPHPIHKHGNKMYQIGAGTGPFPWASVDEAVAELPAQFNLVNPPRRDAFLSLPAVDDFSWVVVRYHVTNPGPWLLHCHIQNHMMGGMMMEIQDGIDKWPKVPKEYVNYGQ